MRIFLLLCTICHFHSVTMSRHSHNSLVHNSAVSRTEIREIMKLRVLPRNHGTGKKSRSVAWLHFGPLYYTDINNEESTSAGSLQRQQMKLLDDNRHYCRLCLVEQQEEYSKDSQRGHLSKVQDYAIATATTCLCDHLNLKHKIKTKASDEGQLLKQGTLNLTVSKANHGKTQTDTTRDFVMWFARDLVPFYAIEKEGLKDFFAKHCPGIKLPHESTLRKQALADVYWELKLKVKEELSGVEALCAMFDGWTDRYKARPYIGLRIAYVSPTWTFQIVTLSCKVLQSHTAQAVADHVSRELADFFGEKRLHVFTTHDGAQNMIKASRLLNVEDFHHCLAHALHLLIMTDSLNKTAEAKDLLMKCKQIVTTLHFKGHIIEEELLNSNDRSAMDALIDKLESLEEDLDQDAQKPVSDVEEDDSDTESGASHKTLKSSMVTRWNSTYTMLCSLLDLEKEVAEALKRTGHVDLLFSTLERNLMKELRAFLRPFKSYTDAVSGCQPHLSLRYMIKHHVLKVVKPTALDHPTIKSIKLKMRSNIERRFPISSSVKIACLLEPGMKDNLDISEPEKIELLQDAIDMLPEIEAPERVASNEPERTEVAVIPAELESTVSKKRKLMEIFQADRQDAPVNSSRFEVNEYLTRRIFSESELIDPLLFWKRKHGEFPRLARLARRYLGICPASVPVENMFSTTGLLLNSKRSSLAPCKVNYISFIHDNYRFFNCTIG